LIETKSTSMALFVCCLFAALLCLRAMSYSAGALALGALTPTGTPKILPASSRMGTAQIYFRIDGCIRHAWAGSPRHAQADVAQSALLGAYKGVGAARLAQANKVLAHASNVNGSGVG
jgi:hypothetical protein